MTSPVLPALGFVVFTPLALLLSGPILLAGELPGKRTRKEFRLRSRQQTNPLFTQRGEANFIKTFAWVTPCFSANMPKFPLDTCVTIVLCFLDFYFINFRKALEGKAEQP